jgi:hypothetical protein
MRKFAIIILSILIAGCATITKGTTELVAVSTPGVEGATCTLISPSVGSQVVVTPGTITLQKGKDNIAVTCTKECYQDGVGMIASNFEGMSAGNVIFGGLIGLGVDATTGAMNTYTPSIQVVMTPIPDCGKPQTKPKHQSSSS